MRDDYLQESNNEYDIWLHNPYWKVFPTITFLYGYPRVLTCKDHYGVWDLVQIHCFRCTTNICWPVSYQVYHAVVKPQTVKHLKNWYNSTDNQMVEQQSLWKGPDTTNVSSVVNTNNYSFLIQ